MAKKKSQRMFSREQRAANRAAIPRASAADRARAHDDIEVATACGLYRGEMPGRVQLRAPVAGDAKRIAEVWFEMREDASGYADEIAQIRACERVFQRLTGDALTVEYVEVLLDQREQERYDAL